MEVHDRLKQLRDEKGKLSQKEVANLLKISQSAYSQIENGSVSLSMSHLKTLSAFYEVTTDWITKGRRPKMTAELGKNEIPLIDTDAQAGYVENLESKDFMEYLERYKVPGFDNGSYRIFEVEGDSMQTTLMPNDFVVCQQIEDVSNFAEGSVCVIVGDKSLIVKRIYWSDKNKDALVLKSDNPKYKDFTMPVNLVDQLWLVNGKITASLHQEQTGIEARLRGMEKEFASLKKSIMELVKKK